MKYVLNYLKGTKYHSILYGNNDEADLLEPYADA